MLKNVILISGIDLESQTSAAYSRIINYAKALQSEGVNFYFSSQVSGNFYLLNHGSIQLIKENAFIIVKYESRFYRFLAKEFHFIYSLKYLKNILKVTNNMGGQTVYLYYPVTFSTTFLTLIYLKILKHKKVFIEKNELQFANRINYPTPSSFPDKISFVLIQLVLVPLKLIEDLIACFFSGIIVISERFKKFYQILRKRKLLQIPILIDSSVFNSGLKKSLSKEDKSFKLCFAGSITENKDDISTIIKLMGEDERFIDLQLHLYGSQSNTTNKKINILVDRYGLNRRFFYHGQISNIALLNSFNKYNLLLLLRKKTLQSDFGFATKLAEYMASGIPVLATDVSDTALYIKNNYNGFLISSSELNEGTISDYLLSIMSNSDLGEIGKRGSITAQTRFNYPLYSYELRHFLFNNG